jgi:hypothetical protein
MERIICLLNVVAMSWRDVGGDVKGMKNWVNLLHSTLHSIRLLLLTALLAIYSIASKLPLQMIHSQLQIIIILIRWEAS